MPIHVAPPIRALEEVLEAAGVIARIDSVGVTIEKNKEAQGKPKSTPIAYQTIGKVVNGQHVKL